MAKDKYVDIPAIMQVIGAVFLDNTLLDNNSYFFDEEDFTEPFHKIIFGTIYNLYNLGMTNIDIVQIEDYISQRPSAYGVFKTYKGKEYLQKLKENTQIAAFDYYYNRMKKMTLLRTYYNIGFNVSWLYDVDNIFDAKKKQAQEDWLDNHSLIEIADIIDNKILDVRNKCVDNVSSSSVAAGDNILSLIESYKKKPEFGIPMYGNIFNTIFRGARLTKVYMRSAQTGLGKTRTMMADACTFSCKEIFNKETYRWEKNVVSEPTQFIATEQDISELQSMALAFVSGVNEEHIITGRYENDEYERVIYAAKVIENSPLYFEELPDFSLQDIENCIKRNVQLHNVKYIAFDYVHTSLKILSEISSKSGVKGLREDNILFLIGVRLKDLAKKYGIFVLTATQLNGSYVDTKVYDQNLLRGAKSLGDKIDGGMIMLKANEEDLQALAQIINKGGFEKPDIKISIYKNRRGSYESLFVWCKSDRGTCRITPLFATKYDYEFVDIKETIIKVIDTKDTNANVKIEGKC